MSEIVTDDLKYTTSRVNHSSIQYRNVSPQGSSSVTTSVTSGVGPTEFLISPACFNPSKSRLEFRASFVAPGATGSGLSTYINANLLTFFSRVVVYDTASNAVLVDCSNFEKYISLVGPSATPLSDFLSKSNGNFPLSETAAGAALAPFEDLTRSINAAGSHNDTGDNIDMSNLNPMMGRRQFLVGPAPVTGPPAFSGVVVIDVSIPFDSFKGTFLQTNKVLYFPTNLVLQLYWSANNQHAFIANTTNPTTGCIPLTTAIAVSNINIALACESNLSIISQVIQQTMSGSGVSFQIPYPTTTRQAVASSSSHSYSLQLTRAYGNTILYLLTAAFNTGANPNFANVHSRGNITVYNTFLNNVAVKYPAGFSALQSEDYIIANKDYLKGGVVQTLTEYRDGEWFHCDSFFGEKSLSSINYHDLDGLDVGSASSTWMIQATMSVDTAYTWITVIMGTKQLSITNMGASVM